jgi:A/G-specific adenine glycosylase
LRICGFQKSQRCTQPCYAKISPVSLLKIPASDLPKFRRRLLSWFAKGKRDLPWRRTRDPYRIWLSEIMLQQTRVAAVIPYYGRFLEAFPDAASLARAGTDRVLALWAGLGYYSRARNLQRAAQNISARPDADFPRDYQEALALPGIGRYTAAAVLSIAYGAPLAVLDGNVARVLARIGAMRGDLRATARWRKLEAAAQELLAVRAPGDWNQAMMELGATVCTPKSPRCGHCPAEKWCRARQLGIVEQIPAVRKKRSAVDVTLVAAVLLDSRGRTLLVRQPNGDGALFSRLWQFPAIESTATGAKREIFAHLKEIFGLGDDVEHSSLRTARHTVTFRKIRLESFLIRVMRLPRVPGSQVIALSQVRGLPVSNATQKIADAAISDTIS